MVKSFCFGKKNTEEYAATHFRHTDIVHKLNAYASKFIRYEAIVVYSKFFELFRVHSSRFCSISNFIIKSNFPLVFECTFSMPYMRTRQFMRAKKTTNFSILTKTQ